MKTEKVTNKNTATTTNSALRFEWSSLPEIAFFQDGPGAQLQHVYLYDEISAKSIHKLKVRLDELSVSAVDPVSGVHVSPRPIVIHINSTGGDVFAGMTMMSLFNEVSVPMCTLVDGMSYSAATFLSVIAPYRVMTPMATALIHDWSGILEGKADTIRADISQAENAINHIRQMYLHRTRLGPSKLDELMHRNIVLSANQCLDLGMCERVLKLKQSSNGKKIKMLEVMRTTILNHVRINYFDEDEKNIIVLASQQLDKMLGSAIARSAMLNGVVFHVDGGHGLSNIGAHVASISARVQALGCVTATYGIIDTSINLINLLPILHCRWRVMYMHASVRMHVAFDYVTEEIQIRDLVYNTNAALNAVRAILRDRTRMPTNLINNIDMSTQILSAKDCLRWGIVDELI